MMKQLSLLALLIFLWHPMLCAEQMIRINIGRASSLEISGKQLHATDNSGDSLSQGDSFTVTATAQGLTFQGKPLAIKQIKITSKNVIRVLDRKYNDNIEINWKANAGKPEILIIHSAPIESYLESTVGSEVPPNWPIEALKAQAITARTYVLWQKFRRINQDYHVVSSVADQVFEGVKRRAPRVEEAVKATAGQVITYDDELIEAYFHSTCGGHTESAKEGWGKAVAYLPGVECEFCHSAPGYSWKWTIPHKELDNSLKSVIPGPVTALHITKKTATGRIKSIGIAGKKKKKTISGLSFRNLMGNTKLKSTWVTDIKIDKGHVTFHGQGYGHGVGLCQYGAMGMAKAGKSANEILLKYFPDTTIRHLY